METRNNPTTIPLVDLEPFRSGDQVRAQAASSHFLEALTTVGFAYVKNHSLPQSLIDEAFTWSARFFDLPPLEKEKAPHPPSGKHHRGYSAPGREKVAQNAVSSSDVSARRAAVPDVKESFDIGREGDERVPNVWPPADVLPGFREFFSRFYEACFALEDDLLRAIAVCLGLPRDYLLPFHKGRENQLRLLRYPDVEEEKLVRGEVERIGAHTDYGTLTFLFQDDVGGLEVEDPAEKGKFNAVPNIPGTVILNVGDFLQRWSNDVLKSTMHRVKAPPMEGSKSSLRTGGGKRMLCSRYSMPYFVGADSEIIVDCLPTCFGPDRPKKYEPVRVRDYVDVRADAAYGTS